MPILNNTFFAVYQTASTPVSPVERAAILAPLRAFARTPEGAFLQCIPLDIVAFRWCQAMLEQPAGEHAGIDGFPDIMGSFDYRSHIIYLQPEPSGSGLSCSANWCTVIAATAAHELYHLYQLRRMGKLLYGLLMGFLLTRQWFLEPPAFRVTDAAARFIERRDAAICAYRMEQRGWEGEDANAEN